jgi:hypothetical protein
MEQIIEKTSKFSSGLNIIMRLDELWKDTHKHSREGKYRLWNMDLDRMWLELARDLDEKKFTQKLEDFKKFDKKIQEIGIINDSGLKGFKVMSNQEIIKRSNHYDAIMGKQLFIARLENELGKGTTFDEGDEDDFD